MSDDITTPFTDIIIGLTARMDGLERRLAVIVGRFDSHILRLQHVNSPLEQRLVVAERRLAQLEQSGAIEKLEDDIATLCQLLEGETDD